MKIISQKRFLKRLVKLSPEIRERVKKIISIFEANPFDVRLHNHELFGPLQGRRSLSVTYDMRIIFREECFYTTVIFLDIGTHSQVY